MSDKEKIVEYELQIEDMLHALQGRIGELDGKKLNEFEEGKLLAYAEMMDIIKTRHKMILDVIEE
jgi:predicted XRE-type DNA-binding protein